MGTPTFTEIRGYKLKRTGGFSLIEAIVSIVLLSIVGLFVFSFLMSSMDGYRRVKERGSLSSKGRMAMDRMIRELRDARRPVSVAGGVVSFTKEHPSPTDSSLNITLSKSGSVLRRTGNDSGAVDLVDNVNAFTPAVNGTIDGVVNLELVLQGASETVRYYSEVLPRN